MRRFIDIGANLTDLMFSGHYNGSKKHDSDLNHVLNRSWSAGVEKIIITGGSLSDSKAALVLANTDNRLYSTVGCHPTRCQEFENNTTPTDYLHELEELLIQGKNKIVAIGECGLDFDRLEFCPKHIQLKYFEIQLKLSKKYNLPLFLHCRNASYELLQILKKYDGFRGVVHSFDGSKEDAVEFINLGFYIGINGCSLKTADNLSTIVTIPQNRLLLETDCPWCEIRPSHAGSNLISTKFPCVKKEKWQPLMIKGRNEPCNIIQVLEVIAGTLKEDPDLLAEIIYNNTIKLFFS